MKIALSIILALVIAISIFCTQITIFVVQPIGAIPEGRTIVMWRLNKTKLISDKTDAMCEREMDGVSLICRLGALTGVMKNAEVLVKLPYSEALYEHSTGGVRYRREPND